jgi:lipoprotein NlpI
MMGETMNRLALWTLLLIPIQAVAEKPKDGLEKARAAMSAGKLDEALKLTDEAIKADPKLADGYSLRGTIHFKLARIPESLADFDKQIELDPKAAPAHWRRGLTLYYAGKFADGVAQFTTSDRAEPEDVENAIWHLLCNARVKGLAEARKEILKVKKDSRGAPMMAIYRLFQGEGKAEDVFAAAEANPVSDEIRHKQRFYAHYYVGMYLEAAGEREKSLRHLQTAVEKYEIGDYMMDVARVHIQLRKMP